MSSLRTEQSLRYGIRWDTYHRAISDLDRFLSEHGVSSPHRLRIKSAAAEIVDNALLHSNAEEIAVVARLESTRLQIAIADDGCGFDSERARLESIPPALPRQTGSARQVVDGGGFARATLLCETLVIRSGEAGSTIELSFLFTPSIVTDRGAPEIPALRS